MTVKVGCESAYYAGRASRDAEIASLQQNLIERNNSVIELNTQLMLVQHSSNKLQAEVEALRAEVNKWHRGAIGLAMGRPFEGPSIYPDAATKEKQDD